MINSHKTAVFVAVIVDAHWTPPFSPLDFCRMVQLEKKFISNISALKILKSASKCRRVKRWINPNKGKTDHISKFGVIPNQHFQAC